jgi:hypothetical protein
MWYTVLGVNWTKAAYKHAFVVFCDFLIFFQYSDSVLSDYCSGTYFACFWLSIDSLELSLSWLVRFPKILLLSIVLLYYKDGAPETFPSSFWCILEKCFRRLPICEKDLLQSLHKNGRDFMCFLKWSLMLQLFLNIMWQSLYKHL